MQQQPRLSHVNVYPNLTHLLQPAATKRTAPLQGQLFYQNQFTGYIADNGAVPLLNQQLFNPAESLAAGDDNLV